MTSMSYNNKRMLLATVAAVLIIPGEIAPLALASPAITEGPIPEAATCKTPCKYSSLPFAAKAKYTPATATFQVCGLRVE